MSQHQVITSVAEFNLPESSRFQDLSGQVFGKLRAKHISGRDKSGRIIWRCVCECGKEVDVRAKALRARQTKSCQCSRVPLKTINLGSITRALFGDYRRHAADRGLEFQLTIDEFSAYISDDCWYCRQKPSGRHTWQKREVFLYNGIDRIDNAKGYVKGNCVPCCRMCNATKANRPYAEFLEWAVRLTDRISLWGVQNGA